MSHRVEQKSHVGGGDPTYGGASLARKPQAKGAKTWTGCGSSQTRLGIPGLERQELLELDRLKLKEEQRLLGRHRWDLLQCQPRRSQW